MFHKNKSTGEKHIGNVCFGNTHEDRIRDVTARPLDALKTEIYFVKESWQILISSAADTRAMAMAMAPSMASKNAIRKTIGRVSSKDQQPEPRSLDNLQIPNALKTTISG